MLSLNGFAPVAEASLDGNGADRLPDGGLGQRAPAIDSRQLTQQLKAYREPRLGRSLWELAITLVPFLVLAGLMLSALAQGQFIALILAIPAGLLLLRLFLIQHDCGHGAFLPNRTANDWLGRLLGVLTFTPYDCWRRSHALHHASTGNLDARGFGDVDTLTLREFHALTRWKQRLYRLYRHPVVLLGFGPTYLFLLRHRLPIGLMKAGKLYWLSAMGTNAAIALLTLALAYQFGLAVVAMVLLPLVLIAASVGVWLFYVQHQFEESHWDYPAQWSFHEAALGGSTHLDLPPVLRWFTANIGVHHVHHLVSGIPFYRLPEVLRAYPQLVGINRLTASQTFATLRLALWDESQRRMVSFSRSS